MEPSPPSDSLPPFPDLADLPAEALAGGFAVYCGLKAAVGIRLDPEEEFNGADLTIHQISASPERETLW